MLLSSMSARPSPFATNQPKTTRLIRSDALRTLLALTHHLHPPSSTPSSPFLPQEIDEEEWAEMNRVVEGPRDDDPALLAAKLAELERDRGVPAGFEGFSPSPLSPDSTLVHNQTSELR